MRCRLQTCGILPQKSSTACFLPISAGFCGSPGRAQLGVSIKEGTEACIQVGRGCVIIAELVEMSCWSVVIVGMWSLP